MNTQKNKAKIIKELLHSTDKELTDEELMSEILSTNVSENSEKNEREEKITFGQKAADAVARFAGSWAFIFSFIAVMVIWMVMNVLLAAKAFDAYPFILLNLVLSCIAAVQAPLIMMSQNRQEVKDRKRAENDYRVNLKSEFVIDALYKKLESVSEMQKKIFKKLEVLSGGETINAADESLSYKEKTEINGNKDKSNRP
jgi:predicted membrane protein